MTVDRPLVGFHAPGDPRGGEPWRTAAADAGWIGPVDFADLPGHAGAEPPIGRTYERVGPAYVFAQSLGQRPELDGPCGRILVGVAVSGWSAQLVALAGRAEALVLVDGLQGPFTPVKDRMTERRGAFRQQAARNIAAMTDPTADAIAANGLDPRLELFNAPISSRSFAEDAARAIAIPTLIVESSDSGTPADDAAELAALFAQSTIIRVDRIDEHDVLAAIIDWL